MIEEDAKSFIEWHVSRIEKEYKSLYNSWELELLYGITDEAAFVKDTIVNYPAYVQWHKTLCLYEDRGPWT